ncbi:tRNA preQ1(34) S-adenosylmethionine ribosyltransferase-isomerase QueA [Thermochromatium tepidum]|uniref:S-adenosylmethionine:tRNA ribosyltransferase-isomerase n=1 Tax=Thermochromatium tepidum ATCC 43061 TaxID=316276 RepID=A0A6I6EB22_THETI|nr:tRNA preQ1(34) S-adenosylmethionine ribosyltransferase-isomerase QueA [Thermochromatium tepidum]QGU33828.1 tRNA preQ1(34) S-adenosylmethionine ribosyltransferase-isomerase QueA [Thermochromatium tepidum ATCC 43061]
MRRSDFHYELPPELIAQYPLPERSGSRLLVLDGSDPRPRDRMFIDLPELLNPHDLLVFNNTRVMRARLFGHKETGGRVEILIERLLDAREALAQVRAAKSPKPGSRIRVTDGAWLLVVGREGDLFRLRALESDFSEQMARHGHIPLPPYIQRPDAVCDESRYQTVFARCAGAIAAPTAGLHFDEPLLARLDALGIARAEITLHVGAGTFQPVREEDLARHHMHSEWLEVTEGVCEQVEKTRRLGGRVIAVGTTSVRSLETAADEWILRPFRGETRLFIRPGYRFKVVDAMITNFHLPESTLFMLVAAFSGYTEIMNAYRHAVEQRYRFFSYGDAMFLTRRATG